MVALAIPLILGLKPTYYAESRLLIQDPLTTALASSAEDRLVRLNLTTEVERMLSRDVAAQVIQELGIDANPEFNPALREGVLARPDPGDLAPSFWYPTQPKPPGHRSTILTESSPNTSPR